MIFFTQAIFSSNYSWGRDVGEALYLQDTIKNQMQSIENSALVAPMRLEMEQEDRILSDTTKTDSLAMRGSRAPILADLVTGGGKDSMIYDIKSGLLYLYKEGDINYIDKKMNADYFEMHLQDNLIIAKGMMDTATNALTKAKFVDGATNYDLDSIYYNIQSEKAKIYGIAFKEGEGTLRGDNIKKMDDGIFNISGGIYTTCDHEHPHFYLALSKAQYVDNEEGRKIIFGPSNLVVEDVPLPLALPFGFFPMMKEKNSGIIIPTFGEESLRGFYLKDFGYYAVLNDYMDLTTQAGIYNLGSWEASLASMYKVRYKFSGNFSLNYSKDIIGTQGSADYQNMNNYKVTWTHSQDSKFLPGTTFSANVNWSSSSYNKYSSSSISDYVSSQTNSSVSFSKTWTGTPFSFTSNIQHSQNNQDSTVMLSMPNMVFSVSSFTPFQRKNAVGKQLWYEKIKMSYTGTFNNSVTTQEDELFTTTMFEQMKYGMKHYVPVSTSMNILKYLNLSPSATYTERWYFNKISKDWDPATSSVVVQDTTQGFYRVYNYNFSAAFSTSLYGMMGFKGKDPVVKAIRHVFTPSISGSYTPDFGATKYGYYLPVQSDATGNTTYYSPYENGIYGVPSRGESAALSFSVGNTLEMKVRNRADTVGEKKIKLIESLSASSSYNFLADSLNLSPFSVSFRTTLFKSLGLNISSTFDPYGLDGDGNKINTYSIKQGKLARLTSMGFSFGYSFRSAFGGEGGTGSSSIPQASQEQQRLFDEQGISYAEQQQLLLQSYYDFSVPWNLSVNYTFSYSKPALSPSVTQTMSFNGSINLTSKMGITCSAGYDFESRSLTPGTIAFSRDLHCWQMSFSWVPVGYRKSWNFTIRANSSMLSDLKYEKSSSYTDNYSSYY
ncbi:MAG: putative LPS assembly protein LptD [Rikenellaceae bacterium]